MTEVKITVRRLGPVVWYGAYADDQLTPCHGYALTKRGAFKTAKVWFEVRLLMVEYLNR